MHEYAAIAVSCVRQLKTLLLVRAAISMDSDTYPLDLRVISVTLSCLDPPVQPYKRENKRTRARDVARAASPILPDADSASHQRPAAQPASSAMSGDDSEDFTFAEPADVSRWPL